jgi:DNA uptake protein ComE-like DNA-binding protein
MKSQHWKDLFDFTAREKRGILVLVSFIIILVGIRIAEPWERESDSYDFSGFEAEIERFEAGLTINENSGHSKNSNQTTESKFDFDKELHDFNPNDISRNEMLKIGFSLTLAENLINFRNAGGIFYKPEDLRKLYHMTDEIYSHLDPFISINNPSPMEDYSEIFLFNPNTISKDSIMLLGFSEKVSERWINYRNSGGVFESSEDVKRIYGVNRKRIDELSDYISIPDMPDTLDENLTIEINSCQYKDLFKVEGMTSELASKIISYRTLLGGYVNPDQLNEVYGMTDLLFDELSNVIIVDDKITKIKINQADFKTLIRHPYLNESDVKALLKYRDYNGGFSNGRDIQRNNLISDSTYQKITPYLSLE